MNSLPKNASPLILTVDIGTSSTRAMLFDRQAAPLADMAAQVPNRLQTTPAGGAEFDPAELLENAALVIDRLLDRAGPLTAQIEGAALSTFVANLMGLDAAGQPVTPVFTYADTRSAPDAAALREEFDEAAVHDRTGCLIHSSYLPARFRWLERTRPHLLEAASHWVSVADYLFGEFLGRRAASYSTASWTGLLDRRQLAWDQAWLSNLPVDEAQLPSLQDITDPVHGLRPAWAKRWPALEDIAWFPALGDGAAANLGSGCDSPERVALTVGTSGAMRVVLPEEAPETPDGLWCYRVDKNRALMGGATSEGGNVFAWLKETLRLPPADRLEEELAALEPAGQALTMLPFLAGERAPGWRDEARASLVGLTLHTRPVEILRAGLEGVAYRLALIHQRLAPLLPPEHQIIGSGGGLSNSAVWLQIMADVLGRPLIASAAKEAASRGAALAALEGLGRQAAKPVPQGRRYQPRPEYQARYQTALARQLDLYERLETLDENPDIYDRQ